MEKIEEYIYKDEFLLIKDDIINNNYNLELLKLFYIESLKNSNHSLLFEIIENKLFLIEKLIEIIR